MSSSHLVLALCGVLVLLPACRFDTSGLVGSGGGSDAMEGPAPDAAGADAALIDASAMIDAAVVIDAPVALPDAPPPDADNSAAGTALRFDGDNDFVRIDRTIGADFTIEAWIRTDKSRGGSNFFDGLGLFHCDFAGGGPRDDFGVSILNDHLAFGVGSPDTTIESTTEVTTGEWVHIAVARVQAQGTLRVFVNGVEERSVDADNRNVLDDRNVIDIGGNVIDDRYFEGDIDEVRVWDRARSASEIASTMNQRLSGTESGLIGYWRLDDGSGQVAVDDAGDNDGRLGEGNSDAAPEFVTSGAPISE
ncbi:MAG: hypothetical protein Tsb0020_03840 [Haliangiales bacterium]